MSRGVPDEVAGPETSQAEADAAAAMEIVRLIDGLERAHPGGRRPLEPHVLFILARRAGWHGVGPDLMQLVRQAISAGEQDRREADAAETQPTPDGLPHPTTADVGHA